MNKEVKNINELASFFATQTRALKECFLSQNTNEVIQNIYQKLEKDLNIKKEEFIDSLCQFIIYVIFIARLRNEESKLSIQTICDYLPAGFTLASELKSYFNSNLLDEKPIILDIIDLLNTIDMHSIFDDYSKKEFKSPFLHFYELFLTEYDNKMKRVNSVYYTPDPVANFIVNSVDLILQQKFNTKLGDDKVTVVDFCTGTGMFLIKAVEKAFDNFEYIDKDVIINNFVGIELMMASYAVTYLRLIEVLRSRGVIICDNKLSIYLDNTLTIDVKMLFNEFNHNIYHANNTLAIIGNPPYSAYSTNKYDLIRDYYYCGVDEHGKRIKLDEKNPKNLQDDYVKFIKYAQSKIDKQDNGVVAIITNNGFIDNITFKGMRWSLLNSFDEIYILDLHGNIRKKEKALDGGKDENIFDIMAGVCIAIFVKTKPKDKLSNTPECRVYHYDLYGDRDSKYDFLTTNVINTIEWNEIKPQAPYYLFTPQDYDLKKEYDKGYPLNLIFKKYGSGMKTSMDKIAIHKTRESLKSMLIDFCNIPEHELRIKYNVDDSPYWKLKDAIENVKKYQDRLDDFIKKVHYRPFDVRWVYYNPASKGMVADKRFYIFKYMFMKNINNPGLVFTRNSDLKTGYCFASEEMANFRLWSCPGMLGGDKVAPLYLDDSDDDNPGLVFTRFSKASDDFNHCFVNQNLMEMSMLSSGSSEMAYLAPLYVCEDNEKQGNIGLAFGRGIDSKGGYCFASEKMIDLRSWTCPGMTSTDYLAPLYVCEDEEDDDEKQGNIGLAFCRNENDKGLVVDEMVNMNLMGSHAYLAPMYIYDDDNDDINLVFKRGANVKTGYCFVSKNMINRRLWSCPGTNGGDYLAPLYLN